MSKHTGVRQLVVVSLLALVLAGCGGGGKAPTVKDVGEAAAAPLEKVKQDIKAEQKIEQDVKNLNTDRNKQMDEALGKKR